MQRQEYIHSHGEHILKLERKLIAKINRTEIRKINNSIRVAQRTMLYLYVYTFLNNSACPPPIYQINVFRIH